MGLKLDSFDRRIACILLENSRESLSDISKKIRLSRENVNYKIKRLSSNGFIEDFYAKFNEAELKIKHCVAFVQLKGLKSNSEQEILDFLKRQEFVNWVGTVAGKWTLIFDLRVPETIAVSGIMNQLLAGFGENIEDYVLLNVEEGELFFEKCLEEKLRNLKWSKKKTRRKKLDRTDCKIMEVLNKNSRASYAEIAEKIGLSANGVKKRIKNLEDSKMIEKYSITLNFKKLGFEWYGIQLKLAKFEQELNASIRQFFRSHPRIIFYYKYLGPWDYDIGFMARDSTELKNFINELRAKFPEELKITDVFITLDEIKSCRLPEGIFKNLESASKH